MYFPRFFDRIASTVANGSCQRVARALYKSAPSRIGSRVTIGCARRAYATPSKPKKGSIGETAKRGRSATKTPKHVSDPAPQEATNTSTPAKTTTTITKPKSRKKPTKKRASKELVAKRKATRANKKAAIVKRKEKLQTRREKAKVEAPKERIRLLKEQALNPPKVGTSSGWLAFWTSKVRSDTQSVNTLEKLQSTIKGATQEYRNLSDSQKEEYVRKAKDQRTSDERKYQEWVRSHEPDQIRIANLARAVLRREKEAAPRRYTAIKDERAPKRPATSFLRFVIERSKSENDTITENAKAAGQEWKTMTDVDKREYVEAYQRDKAKYISAYERLYGAKPGSASGPITKKPLKTKTVKGEAVEGVAKS